MNTVNTKLVPPITNKTTVDELIGSNMHKHGRTAFVGSVGYYQELFLITYDAVVLASEPNITWVGNVKCTVNHYCDVTITEKE